MNFEFLTSPRVKWLSPPVLLIIATIAVYAVTGGFDLLSTWDDKYYLTTNETIDGFTGLHLKQAFSDYYVGNYAPLHILSYMIDHVMWGLHPTGYHLENVLFHLANGLLFYLLLRHLDMTEWQAGAAAWIFLLHPVQVETVAWVSQRKSLLAMFFFLIAMLGYQSYAERQTNKASNYLISVLSIAAAMLCKSVAVIFPAVIILYDLTYGRSGQRSTVRRGIDKLPFIAVAAAVAVMAIISQGEEVGGGRREFPGGSPLATFFTMVPVLMSYIRDCFWPFEISPYYMVTIRQQPDSVFVAALVALLLLAALGVYLYRTARPQFFGFALFFIALAPVLQFVPLITLKNDRYLYTSLLGFAMLIVIGAKRLQEIIPSGWQLPYRSAVVIIMLALPVFACKQTLYWKDDVTIWNRAVVVDPDNRLAWLQLAKGYTARSDSPNAIRAFNRYQELRNRYGPVRGFENQ